MRAITSAIVGQSRVDVFEVRYKANAFVGFIGEHESGQRRRKSSCRYSIGTDPARRGSITAPTVIHIIGRHRARVAHPSAATCRRRTPLHGR
jgi:hypothetical protein